MSATKVKSQYESRATSLHRRMFLTLVFLGTLAVLPGCALVHHYDAITGKVVDLDTGEPLEGAAVHASYYTDFYTMVDGTKKNYINSHETLTDINGGFAIPSQFAFAFRPMNLFSEHVLFVIYKPGYGCYGRCSHQPCGKFLDTKSVDTKLYFVGLPKLKTTEEQRLSTYCIPADGDYPILIDLLNKMRQEFGIQKLKNDN